MGSALLDVCGRRRSPATLPGCGRPPMNKGLRYPADPPSVEEIVAVMRGAGDRTDGVRLRGLIVVLWRAGLRISEGLSFTESDPDPMRGKILVRRGKGGKRRISANVLYRSRNISRTPWCPRYTVASSPPEHHLKHVVPLHLRVESLQQRVDVPAVDRVAAARRAVSS
jgi:integrase